MVHPTLVDHLQRRLDRAKIAPAQDSDRAPSLLDDFAQATWETDAAGCIIADSPSWRTYTGQSAEQRSGFGWLAAVHSEDRGNVERQWREAIAAPRPVDIEFRLQVAGDGWRWTNMRALPSLNEDGSVQKWIGINLDVDAKRRAENAMRDSEARLRAFVTASSDVIYSMSPDWSEMRQLDGRAFLDDTMGPTSGWMAHYIPPDEQPEVARAIEEAIRTKGLFELEHRVRRADGTLGWTLSRAAAILDEAGEITGWLGSAKDVTDRRRTQERLRESEERFRQFADASFDALWIRDAGTLAMEYVSPAIEAIYGIGGEEILGAVSLWTDLVVPSDREVALAHVERARDGEAVVHEFRIRRPSDGAVRWIRDTDFPLRDERGRVQRVGGIAEDVTDLKATEAALSHSEQRLRNLVEGVPLLVWRAVDAGDWTWSSPQWKAYTGQAEPDSHGLGWLEPVHPDDHDGAMIAWARALQTGGVEAEYRIRRQTDGAYRWFQTQATPVRNADGEVVEWLGTSTDIEDIKRLQERQDVLVAELQHRTRNLIAVVQGVAEETMEHTGPTDAFREAFADRLSALSRVQGLLSRSDAEPITISALVRLELDALGAGTLGGQVTAEGPETFLKPSTVQTLALALHELATNARKYGALSHGGGKLAVIWRERIEGDEHRLVLDWVETGLEQVVEQPASKRVDGGYGRELIERALPHALGARTSYALSVSGVRCTLDLPVRSGRGGSRDGDRHEADR